MPLTDASIAINSIKYPCVEWRTAQEGRRLKQGWNKGFKGGSGKTYHRDEEQYYYAASMDTTTAPWIRLPPAKVGSTLNDVDINLSGSQRVFSFLAQSANGTNFIYFIVDRHMLKVKISDTSLDDDKDLAVNSVGGRAAHFDGAIYIPFGPTNDAQKITTVADSGADTFSTITDIKARHFAATQRNGVAQLARAHTTNKIDLSSDGADYSGDDFAVGSSSQAIQDLLEWDGELAVAKSDAIYRFDQDGLSRPIFPVAKSDFVEQDVGVAAVTGPYFYWPHSTGLYRFVGDLATQVGPEADPDYYEFGALDSQPALFAVGGWRSVAISGRWIYATTGGAKAIHQGYIRGNGKITWYGHIYTATGDNPHVFISDTGPALWIVSNANIERIALQKDGSTRNDIGTARGEASKRHSFFASKTDLGLPTEQKQGRLLWALVEDITANETFRFKVSLDGAAAAAVGTDESGLGGGSSVLTRVEKTWTSGTSDTFYDIQVEPEIQTAASTPTTDPRIRAFGIEAVTPAIYQATIPLDNVSLKNSGVSLRRALKNLRDLKNGKVITIADPENPSSTFNGRIVALTETAVDITGGTGYLLDVRIERYDFGDGV